MRSLLLSTAAAAALSLAILGTASAAGNSSLSGRVVDIKTLQPVPDAKVEAFMGSSYRAAAKATTDAHGAFVLQGLDGGNYRVQFEKAGYQRTMIAGINVRSGERMIEAAPIAMYPNGVPLPNFAMAKPCGSMVDPEQTADVYIVCSQ